MIRMDWTRKKRTTKEGVRTAKAAVFCEQSVVAFSLFRTGLSGWLLLQQFV